MCCTSPKWLAQYSLSVPCGKCIACRIRRSSEWALRCVHEAESWKHSCFVTLTYRTDDLPESGSISKRELQLYLKRLRKSIEPRRIRYFASGEYGDPLKESSVEIGLTNGRPHYHLIIFGIAPSEHVFRGDSFAVSGPVVDCWQRGFVYVGTVTYNSARYVSKYIQKKLFGKRAVEYGDCEAPFQMQSQGLGKDWALESVEDIVREGGVLKNGKNVGVPRYYRKLIEDTEYGESLKEVLLSRAEENRIEERVKAGFPEVIDDLESFERLGSVLADRKTQRGIHLRKKVLER